MKNNNFETARRLVLTFLALLPLIGVLDARADFPCSATDVATAQHVVDTSEQLFQAGLLSKLDWIVTRLPLLDLEYCAGQLSKSNFCSEKGSLIEEGLKGAGAPTDRVAFQSKGQLLDHLVRLRISCAK